MKDARSIADDRMNRQGVRAVRECRSVLMVGTHMTTMGGISTVVRGYLEAGLFERFDCTYVATHRDGSALNKLLAALRGWFDVCRALARFKAPLVHVHLSSRASFWRKSVVCLLAMASRRPYLLHVHGSEFMRFYNEESSLPVQRFVQLIFKRSALLLALSEQWRDNILHICPTANVDVLTNAVALPKTQSVLHVPDGAMTLLFLGRLGERKGTFDLVRAFARVAPDFPRTRLTCAGDGAIQEVIALARELGIGDRVDCPGWLSTGNTRDALGEATIFVLPSYNEGLPMSLLEAMSWGLPVVSSPVGGIPQVLRHNDNGLLVSPGDIEAIAASLHSLLGDAALRMRLGRAARQTIQEAYSLEASVEMLSRIYRRFGIPMRPG